MMFIGPPKPKYFDQSYKYRRSDTHDDASKFRKRQMARLRAAKTAQARAPRIVLEVPTVVRVVVPMRRAKP